MSGAIETVSKIRKKLPCLLTSTETQPDLDSLNYSFVESRALSCSAAGRKFSPVSQQETADYPAHLPFVIQDVTLCGV